jgi:hypothetical protein
VRVTVDGESMLVSGLLTGEAMVDLQEARERLAFEGEAVVDLRARIAYIRDQGRDDDAQKVEDSLERSLRNETPDLFVWPQFASRSSR